MQSALCIHETRMVPRFFALYRETEFFFEATFPRPQFVFIRVHSWFLAFNSS